MGAFKRMGNPFGTTSRGRPSRLKGTRTPAPYPAPPLPEGIPEEPRSGLRRWIPTRTPEPAPQVTEPASDLKSALVSLTNRDRGIAGAVLAAVALVGIGIGYALPGGFTDESASQPVAGYTEPLPELDSESPLPAPAPVAGPAPRAVADTALVPNADQEPAPPSAPMADPASAPQPAPMEEGAPAQQPVPIDEPAPALQPEPVAPAAVYYANCTAVRAAGAAPIFAGQPGYGTHLDGDKDGIACDVTG